MVADDLFPHELKVKPERIGTKEEETKLVNILVDNMNPLSQNEVRKTGIWELSYMHLY